MIGIDNFYLFIISASIFIITPGIDTVFVINKSLSNGTKSGIYASIGICCGILVHTIFASLGLSIILAKSAIAFSLIKYLGAVYLIYLGVNALRSKNNSLDFSKVEKKENSNWNDFRTGIITNVLNPKVALFFLSFFPQFINIENNSAVQFTILGLSYGMLGMIWCFFLAYFSSLFSSKIKGSPKFSIFLNKFSGIVYILMGLKIALTKK